MKSRLAIAIGLAVVAGADASRGESESPLGSSCEASAARFVACPEWHAGKNCLLVGDNELSRSLLLYTVSEDGRLADETPIALGVEVKDIEAIEVTDGRVWVVGSHSRKSWREGEKSGSKKQCPRDAARLALFEADWPPASSAAALAGKLVETKKKAWQKLLGKKCRDELFDLGATDSQGRALAHAACDAFRASDENASSDRAACESGLNLEGAAAIPDAKGTSRLWLGLRAPTVGGKALLLRLRAGDAFGFDGIASVDLGEGRGVREMNYAGGRLWFLAGPVADSSGIAFALESVEVPSLDSGAQLEAKLVAKVSEHSEGLAIAADGSRALIVTDGEKGEGDAKACKVGSTYFGVPIQ